MGFPGNSAGKESACNAGDPSSIPGSGRSPGEGIGHPLQYSWDSPVAQMVKSLPVMRETWIWSLGWEDPLEEGMATYSSILPGESPWTGEPGRLQSMGLHRVRHNWHDLACTSLWATVTFMFVSCNWWWMLLLSKTSLTAVFSRNRNLAFFWFCFSFPSQLHNFQNCLQSAVFLYVNFSSSDPLCRTQI